LLQAFTYQDNFIGYRSSLPFRIIGSYIALECSSHARFDVLRNQQYFSSFKMPVMKKLFLLLLPVIVSSCQKELPQQPQQTQTASLSRINIPDQINFTQAHLYPEGIAFDKSHDRFLVSSFGSGTWGTPYYGTGTIGAVSFNGEFNTVVHDTDLQSTIGLHIDEARKRIVTAVGHGWFDDVAKVGAYDLETGKRIWLADLASLRPGEVHLADDLTMDPQGNVYITDARSPLIYKVGRERPCVCLFSKTISLRSRTSFPYYFVGFNGIVYDNDGFLIVGFYAGSFIGRPSLVKIPVNDPQNFSAVQLDVPIASPDGLLLSRDGKELIIVDNEFFAGFAEIVHMTSTDNWASAKRVETFTMGPTSYATTATSDGSDIFVMDGYIGAVDTSDYLIQKIPFKFKSF
jgi:sugar lactone lactonase YvrE